MQRKKVNKKVLGIVLALVLACGVTPVLAFAVADGGTTENVQENALPSADQNATVDEVAQPEATVQEATLEEETASLERSPHPAQKTDLSECTITWDKLTYNGTEQSPKVTVKKGSTIFVENRDYTVSCTKQTDAGVYDKPRTKLKIAVKEGPDSQLKGNEPVIREWKIEKADIPADAITAVENLVYNGSEQTLVAENLPDGTSLSKWYVTETPWHAYSWEASVNKPEEKDAATYYVYYDIDGGKNYNSVKADNRNWQKSKHVTVTIDALDITDAEVVLSSSCFIYNGNEQTTTIKSVTKNHLTLTSEDYEVAGDLAGSDAGRYTV